MFPTLINPLAMTFTIATTFGVLVHDTQIDRASMLAITVPSAYISYAAVDSVNKSSEQHVHVERVSAPAHFAGMNRSTPRIQPRDDDRRYIQSKKLNFGTMGSGYLWPSV